MTLGLVIGLLSLSVFQFYLWTMPEKCPRCKKPADKIIYLGLPGTMCTKEECHCMSGMASYAALAYFNGHFFTYPGSYWVGLYHWVKVDFNNLPPE